MILRGWGNLSLLLKQKLVWYLSSHFSWRPHLTFNIFRNVSCLINEKTAELTLQPIFYFFRRHKRNSRDEAIFSSIPTWIIERKCHRNTYSYFPPGCWHYHIYFEKYTYLNFQLLDEISMKNIKKIIVIIVKPIGKGEKLCIEISMVIFDCKKYYCRNIIKIFHRNHLI